MSSEPHLLNLSAEFVDTDFTEMISINIICRLCANQSDKLIGIFSDDGVTNDLSGKMNLYLPIKVSESDNLPLQCCLQCASTVLAWHDLVVTSVEADRRLRSCQFVSEKQLVEIASFDATENLLADNGDDLNVDNSPKQNILYETIEADLLDENVSQIENVDKNNETSDLFLSDSDDTSKKELPQYSKNCPHDANILSIKKENSIDEQNDEEENIYNSECPFCSTLFSSENELKHHLENEHPDLPSISFNSSESMEKNAGINEQKETKKKCRAKPKKNASSNRTFHVRHMIKEPLPKINQDEVNLAKVVVDGRVFYMCKVCGKSLHSVYTYVWHMRIHTGERPYVCDLCGKQFRVSQGLVRHLKETHERIKNFSCDLCGRFFATKRNVEEHRRIHTNERPYVCATCGKAFKQKASLFVHNRSHSTEFPYNCTHCPQKFRTKQSLLTHITRHTGEKPFPCDVCGRNFRIKYELKRHKLIHSENKPFICKICEQSFRQKRYLRNHLKLHHHIPDPNDILSEYKDAI